MALNMLCPTLEVYILVSQDEQHIEVYRRSMGWKQERFSAGQTVMLEQLDLELPVGLVYEGVLQTWSSNVTQTTPSLPFEIYLSNLQ